MGEFGVSQFSDTHIGLFSLYSCFQGGGSGICSNKEGIEYFDFITIKRIGKKRTKGGEKERGKEGTKGLKGDRSRQDSQLPCKLLRPNGQCWDYYLVSLV